MSEPTRHADDGTTVFSFSDHFLVSCPHCGKCARTAPIGKKDHRTLARFSCTHCGASKDREVQGWTIGLPSDWYFDVPLWLQMPCCGETLWAYNREHLEYLRSYVAADHRTRNSDANAKISNATMASRLPKWMITAKHRNEVLRCIDALQKTLTA